MPNLQDELHRLIDDLTDDQVATLLSYAHYLDARSELAVSFWPEAPLLDWEEDPEAYFDLAPAFLR